MITRIALVALGLLAGSRTGAAIPLDVRFEQRVGAKLPLDATFIGEDGAAKPLGDYLAGKPAVLIFNYLRCPEICSLVSSGTIDTLRELKASAGPDFVVISVSIDPGDTPEMARSKQREDVQHYGRSGSSAGWHSLVGSAASIRALTAAAGFHYAYDPRSRQFAHPTGVVVVTPSGVISGYFLGVDFPVKEVATSLRRASRNETGGEVFSLLFVCFQGGSPEGRYGRVIWIVLWASVALTLAGVFGGIAWMVRTERAHGEGGSA